MALPAPVAPAHGTAASTTATERSDSSRNCRAIVSPMIPAPTTTTSNEWDDALIGLKPETLAVSDRLLVIFFAEKDKDFPRNLLPNKLENGFRRETTTTLLLE